MAKQRLAFLVGLLFCLTSSASNQSRADAVLVGRITDTQGCPLASVTIRLMGQSGAEVAKTTTSPAGEFRLENVPRGRAEASIELAGFRTGQQAVTLQSGENLLDSAIALGRIIEVTPHRVAGVVRTSDGLPLVGATVSLLGAFDHVRLAQVRTDSTGKYQIETTESGQFILVASHVAHDVQIRVVDFKYDDGQSAQVEFHLMPRPYCNPNAK